MSRSFFLNMELEYIRSFLERVDRSVEHDCLEIARRAEAGEFTDEDDENNAYFDPTMSEEIAVRAALGELNALVEQALQHVAAKPLAREQVRKKPKRNKMAWDLKRDDLHLVIGNYYQISIDDLPGSTVIDEIRRTVNAYKHRGGFKDPRRDTDSAFFPEKFQLERERVFHQIESVHSFLNALWVATMKQQATQSE